MREIHHAGGEKPITKNILVTDLTGKKLAPTYARRAKSLIKKGRARWSDDGMTEIRLLVSPEYYYKGDNAMDMDESEGIMADTSINETLKSSPPKAEPLKTANGGEIELTVGYILGQIEKIRSDTAYIYESLKQVQNIQPFAPTMNSADYASQSKADAIGAIVGSREATNQKLLSMYEQMYNDIKPVKAVSGASEKEMMLKWVREMAASSDYLAESIGDRLDTIIKEMLK